MPLMDAPHGMGKLGDWFDPTCAPGSTGCVPHWYCYIPLMATPDCLASFETGTQALVSGVTGAAVGTVGSVGKGVAQGVGTGTCTTIFGSGQFAQQICQNPVLGIALGVGVLFGLLALFKKGGGTTVIA